MTGLDVTETALSSIKNLIITHQYKPGDRLLETALAKELSLSRTPVRDALARLESVGFLEKQKGHRGYWIPLLTPKEMKSVFSIRGLLEGHAARIAAQKRTEEDIQYLRELNEEEIKAFYDGRKEDYSQINELFHFTINTIADDIYLRRFFEQIFWRSKLYDFFFAGFYNFKNSYKDEKDKRLSYKEHKMIIDVIERQDADESEKMMRFHMKEAYKHLLNGGFDVDFGL